MRMNSEEIKKQIAEMQQEIKKEEKYSKRWCFLAATINSYRKETGKPKLKEYTW